jgi:ATP-binding cassette, subfamily C (CFTR/MRP), member 1
VQRNLIDILNALFFVIYTLTLLISLSKENQRYHKRWFFIFVSLCCAVTGAAYVVSGLYSLSRTKISQLELVTWSLRGLNWIILAISLNFQRNKWTKTISLVWWISFSLLISAYYVEVLVTNQKLEIFELLSWPINFFLLICSLLLLSHKITNVHQCPLPGTLTEPLLVESIRKNSNLYRAGIFSRLTFSWLNHLLKLGRMKPLNLDDIPSIDSEDTSLQASEKFLAIWRAYMKDKFKANSKNLIFLTLFKCYKWDLLLTGFYALLKTVSIASSPLLLFAFIDYSNLVERNTCVGITLVICLIGMKFLESLSQRHWYFESRRCGMRMRSALMACIFQKQLKLSNNGRKKHATGEIVNYIGVDAYRLGDFPWWFHMAWSSPLQLFFSLIILFWSLGLGAIPGLVPLVIFGVLNLPFARILQGYQSKFMVAQDERLRATSEALNNMKIIKLQSWEERFRRIIGSLREIEFKWLGETQLKRAYGTALYWMSPTVVSAVMFAGAAVTGSAPLNASTIFTVLAALRVMAEPVRMLPEILTIMIQVKVSLDRIQVFLLEDEIKEDDVKRDCEQDSGWAVKVEGGVFSWDTIGGTLTLKDVGLEVKRGEKVAVCGPVGAGKSSLLYALLGEIPKINGSVSLFYFVLF